MFVSDCHGQKAVIKPAKKKRCSSTSRIVLSMLRVLSSITVPLPELLQTQIGSVTCLWWVESLCVTMLRGLPGIARPTVFSFVGLELIFQELYINLTLYQGKPNFLNFPSSAIVRSRKCPPFMIHDSLIENEGCEHANKAYQNLKQKKVIH